MTMPLAAAPCSLLASPQRCCRDLPTRAFSLRLTPTRLDPAPSKSVLRATSPRTAIAHPDQSLRIYTAEADWTLTGALADHRLALRPELVRQRRDRGRPRARRLAAAMGRAARGRALRQSRRGRSRSRAAARPGHRGTPPSRRSARAVPLDQRQACRSSRFHCTGRSARCRKRESLGAFVGDVENGKSKLFSSSAPTRPMTRPVILPSPTSSASAVLGAAQRLPR